MAFKQYRVKGVIEAQMVERDMRLPDGTEIKAGDYLTLTEGVATYTPKADFETKYEPYRQKKAPTTNGKAKSKTAKTKAAEV